MTLETFKSYLKRIQLPADKVFDIKIKYGDRYFDLKKVSFNMVSHQVVFK